MRPPCPLPHLPTSRDLDKRIEKESGAKVRVSQELQALKTMLERQTLKAVADRRVVLDAAVRDRADLQKESAQWKHHIYSLKGEVDKLTRERDVAPKQASEEVNACVIM